MRLENLNYYEVLEVSPQATQDNIYSAYCEAKSTFNLSNPEIYNIFSPKEAQDWVELIDEAYSVIGFPNSRRQYDIELKSNHLTRPEVTTTSKTTPRPTTEPLPKGYGQTKYSRYKIIASMEEMLTKANTCDGLYLKKSREYKNIDLTDFSKITCIAIRHLYAIENNNFSVLPAGVFVRGYIIQYCRILGLDEEKVVSSFMTLFNDAR